MPAGCQQRNRYCQPAVNSDRLYCNTHYLVLRSEMMGESMSLTMQMLSKRSETFKFERLLIGYISKFKDRLLISSLALIRMLI